jgi:hypothetical protein
MPEDEESQTTQYAADGRIEDCGADADQQADLVTATEEVIRGKRRLKEP